MMWPTTNKGLYANFCSCSHLGKSPADNLTQSLITHLFTIAGKRPLVREEILNSIWAYLDKLSKLVVSENGNYALACTCSQGLQCLLYLRVLVI